MKVSNFNVEISQSFSNQNFLIPIDDLSIVTELNNIKAYSYVNGMKLPVIYVPCICISKNILESIKRVGTILQLNITINILLKLIEIYTS